MTKTDDVRKALGQLRSLQHDIEGHLHAHSPEHPLVYENITDLLTRWKNEIRDIRITLKEEDV